ncbi:hypothetical protein SteCoe_4437 [Stentor coeruleus]|uniref:Major facilitator superfamily (MFS) profile domain-containing protein n=1 Tax=Stentor coeruleus TaxID=5963 RepID=A0A1R2CUJ3_9CILI|nr:hypothetical protein SteCoe_4437 [Stentor coeruleus]
MSEEDALEDKSLVEQEPKEISPFDQYILSWKDLSKAPIDLWLIYANKFFNYHTFTTFVSSLAIYLSDVKEVSDNSLSIVFGLIGLGGFTFGLLLGNFADRHGIKLSLILGNLMHTLKYVLICVNQNIYFQLFVIIFLGAISVSLANPALESGIKHYTDTNYRTLAVSCYGSISYLAFLLSGIAIEILLAFGSKDEESFRLLFIYCAAVSLVAFILSFFVRDSNYQYISENQNEVVHVVKHSGWEHTREVLILKNFWRFFIVIWMIVIIRTVFYHQSIVLPLYMDRDLGDDTHYGAMIILNQIIIILTIPFFSYTIYYIGPYTMFVIVGLIAALSPMFFMLGASYSTIIMFIVITSIGESLLAPRILEYTYEVAPKGKESVVLAISYLPLIFSIMFAGISGGILLDNFCPEDGEKSCWKVWGIIAIITVPAVLILFIFRRSLENRKFESQPFVSCSKESQED